MEELEFSLEMEKRQQEITQLNAYTQNIEKEVTLLAQNLRWDKEKLSEKQVMVVCKHNADHRIPMKDRDIHEKQCYLTKLGYSREDMFLPDPVDCSANTLVKFSKEEISHIIESASANDPLFKRGVGCAGPEPLTVEQLQRAYTSDERRAIHDAVVNAAPFCHDLTDLESPSSNDDAQTTQKKSRLEILAELRNMRRRRTKYRVAPKTRNYSDVLRDVIKTQMESYGEARTTINTEHEVSLNISNEVSENILHDVVVTQERLLPEKRIYNKYAHEDSNDRHRERSREMGYDNNRSYHRSNKKNRDDRGYYEDSSKDRSRKNYEKSYRDDDSIHYDTNERRSSETRYDDRRKHSKNTYSSKGQREKYKSDGDDRFKHDVIIKQERASPSENNSGQDIITEKRHRDSERSRKKHSWEERDGNHCDTRYIPEKVIKQERESPEKYCSSRNGDGSRKRSRDRRHEDRNRCDYERSSSKRSKVYDTTNR